MMRTRTLSILALWFVATVAVQAQPAETKKLLAELEKLRAENADLKQALTALKIESAKVRDQLLAEAEKAKVREVRQLKLQEELAALTKKAQAELALSKDVALKHEQLALEARRRAEAERARAEQALAELKDQLAKSLKQPLVGQAEKYQQTLDELDRTRAALTKLKEAFSKKQKKPKNPYAADPSKKSKGKVDPKSKEQYYPKKPREKLDPYQKGKVYPKKPNKTDKTNPYEKGKVPAKKTTKKPSSVELELQQLKKDFRALQLEWEAFQKRHGKQPEKKRSLPKS